jgi:copper chaperone
MKFHIENMTCGGCARGVTKAIQSVDPDAVVKADPPSRTVDIQTSATKEKIEAVLCEVGYPPEKS